jgi:hypothetical protein
LTSRLKDWMLPPVNVSRARLKPCQSLARGFLNDLDVIKNSVLLPWSMAQMRRTNPQGEVGQVPGIRSGQAGSVATAHPASKRDRIDSDRRGILHTS